MVWVFNVSEDVVNVATPLVVVPVPIAALWHHRSTRRLSQSDQSDHYGQDCDERSDTTENASVASVFAGHGKPPVPRNQGPWVRLRTDLC